MAEVRSDCVRVFGPISALRDLDESTDSRAISRLDLRPNPSHSSAKDFCNGLLEHKACQRPPPAGSTTVTAGPAASYVMGFPGAGGRGTPRALQAAMGLCNMDCILQWPARGGGYGPLMP